jgi:hypothetical protein
MTGVSKLAKTGIFSGLNNLDDITIDTRYSALCGYTQTDLETVFAGYLKDFNPNEVRDWYNGYSWTGESVYNPFDILLLFSKKTFRPYWFETGTPTFLIKLWQSKPRLPAEYDGLIAGDDLLGSFDPEQIRTETLLFQAGYLTIRSFVSNPYEGRGILSGFQTGRLENHLTDRYSLLFRIIMSRFQPRLSETFWNQVTQMYYVIFFILFLHPFLRTIIEKIRFPDLKDIMQVWFIHTLQVLDTRLFLKILRIKEELT